MALLLIVLIVVLLRGCASSTPETTPETPTATKTTTKKTSKKTETVDEDEDTDEATDESTDSDATKTTAKKDENEVTKVKVSVAKGKTAWIEVKVDGKSVYGAQATGPLSRSTRPSPRSRSPRPSLPMSPLPRTAKRSVTIPRLRAWRV